jgi:hypothetical protein
MSVDLRRSQVRVAQELLDRPEVGPSLQEMGGVRVAHRVGVQDPAVGQRMALDDAPGVTR